MRENDMSESNTADKDYAGSLAGNNDMDDEDRSNDKDLV